MKKLTSLLIASLILALSVTFTGCFYIDADTKKAIAGTYELTRYYKSGNAENTVDVLKEKNIVCYLVIPEEGNGYYVYKDDDTDAYALESKISFEESKEEKDKYEYVVYTNDVAPSSEKFGYRKGGLNKQYPVFKGSILDGTLTTDYTVYIDYKKVDSAQDLSYVTKKIKDLPVYKLGEYAYNGYFRKSSIDCPAENHEQADEYVYYFIRLDSLAKKATEYYMKRGDKIRRVQTVDYSVAPAKNEYGNDNYNLTIGDKICPTSPASDQSKFFRFNYEITVYDEPVAVKIYLGRDKDLNDGNIEENIVSAIQEYERNYPSE